MNKDIYEILENCLNEIEAGAEVNELLAKYPEYAAELRPILQASLDAQSLAVPAPSATVIRRNRIRIMQRLAQMRAEASSPFAWFARWRPAAVTLTLGLLILMSGTNLVRAASDTIPGDGLYTVKRSWENVVLFFAVDPQTKNSIQIKYEEERLYELDELFADNRSATVDFSGRVSSQNGDGWWIANVLVIISPGTSLPDGVVEAGSAVRVSGFTRGDGLVLANTIELLPMNIAVPEVEVEDGPLAPMVIEELPDVQGSTPTSIVPAVVNGATPEPKENDHVSITQNQPTSSPEILAPKLDRISGSLRSIEGDIWTVNGVTMNVTDAVIKGVPSVGAKIEASGYYLPNGVFVVTQIEIINSGNGNNDLGNSGSVNSDGSNDNNHNYNSNDNNNDDHYEDHGYNDNNNDNSNENSNDNHNDNYNSNENDH